MWGGAALLGFGIACAVVIMAGGWRPSVARLPRGVANVGCASVLTSEVRDMCALRMDHENRRWRKVLTGPVCSGERAMGIGERGANGVARMARSFVRSGSLSRSVD